MCTTNVRAVIAEARNNTSSRRLSDASAGIAAQCALVASMPQSASESVRTAHESRRAIRPPWPALVRRGSHGEVCWISRAGAKFVHWRPHQHTFVTLKPSQCTWTGDSVWAGPLGSRVWLDFWQRCWGLNSERGDATRRYSQFHFRYRSPVPS